MARRVTQIFVSGFVSALIAASFVLSSGCTFKKAELGSSENPVKLFFVPSVDAKVIDASSKDIKAYLEANTPYKFEIKIPQSYIAVVEAFGSNQADVAALNTFGYLLANKKYGTEAKLTVIRYGASTYQAQFLARQDDAKITDLKDLEGKKIAFVDPASTSGYLLPMKMLKDAGIKIGEHIFAMKHDNVVSMIINKQVDAGATFYSPPENGEIQDARRLVKTQFPDVEKTVRIVKLTEPIPNDPIVFRKEMPEDMKTTIIGAFMKFVATPEGKESFKKVYGVTDLQAATDADYDKVRKMMEDLGVDVGSVMSDAAKK
ncbi:MAG: phosphate/phosphite/phosphonate ABC transporter substrate-binding protein [Bdellovibrionaceae bacterium]|nr:phosphate/phosphite/phosphonate ABC transporter substrate-binding protein [Pseudobdellovibrionaceae bacterium]